MLFQENVAFDRYFGTYAHAANVDGQPFTAAVGTPAVDGLTPELLSHNPNAAQPRRLGGPGQQVTCDQDHAYRAEQLAFDGGVMDRFVENTESGLCPPPAFGAPGLVMGYYDGNTLTALWNYAQHYSLSDNFYGTTFGPSTPGHLNLISGQTHGVTTRFIPHGRSFPPHTVIGDAGGGQGTDQASILRFVEDNWDTGRVGDHSFDERAGSLAAMFDFSGPAQPALRLDPHTGNPR